MERRFGVEECGTGDFLGWGRRLSELSGVIWIWE